VSGNRPKNVSYSSPDDLVVGNTIQEPFTDSNGNGVWNTGEPFTDSNDNGKHDLAIPVIDVSSGLRVSAYGLPPGLSLDRVTGDLSGTPTARGAYSATVFVQNGTGWTKRTIVLNVR
jgi:hypothetical protein